MIIPQESLIATVEGFIALSSFAPGRMRRIISSPGVRQPNSILMLKQMQTCVERKLLFLKVDVKQTVGGKNTRTYESRGARCEKKRNEPQLSEALSRERLRL